jgi:hypothetical protein
LGGLNRIRAIALAMKAYEWMGDRLFIYFSVKMKEKLAEIGAL